MSDLVRNPNTGFLVTQLIYLCSKVDNNEQYDDLDVLNLDAEEKYFDDDDSHSVHSIETMET